MRRLWLYLIGVILLAGAGVAVFVAVDHARDNKSRSNKTSDLTTTKTSQKACLIFTLDEARQILGPGAKGGANQVNGSSQGDLDVSSCAYSQDSGTNAPTSSSKTASLLVHVPLTSAGSQSNIAQFTQLEPADSQRVFGYGERAYWDAKHGQLNILSNNAWYVLTFGPVTPSARTVDQTKQLANLLYKKL